MPSEPIRFIHAARLMLDHQLRGAGTCPAESRTLVEDATLLAFEQVIQRCLDERVDFLLLVGDSFERHDQGLRGQAALARGLARLDEHNIPAFVTSGRRDPWSAWLPGLRFSENVHRIDPNAVPVQFQKDGRTLARVFALDPLTMGETPPVELRNPAAADGPFSIALVYWDDALRLRPCEDRQQIISEWLATRRELGIDYWAMGGGAGSHTWPLEHGLAHDPGSPQALRSAEAGLHGCTLWEIDSAGTSRSTFLPTSAVRFESRHVALDPHWRRDDLLHAIQQSLNAVPAGTDKLWIVSWRFDGEGPLFESLLLPAFRNELLEALQPAAPAGVSVAHDFRVPVYVPQALIESDRFSSEFVQAVAERTGRSAAAMLAESSLRGSVWESRLAAILSDLEGREIAAGARGAGLRWFAREGVSA